MNYSTFNNIDNQLWNSFVSQHSESNIFHSIEFAKAIDKIENCKPILLAQESKGKIVALTVGYLYSEFSGALLKRLTQRALFQGGILFDEKADINAFLRELNILCKSKKAIYSNIVQLDNIEKQSLFFKSEKFKVTAIYNYYFYLSEGIDNVWNGFKSKKRQNIRKAIKNGLTVSEGDIDNLKDVYHCISYTYKKLKLPLFDFSFLESIYKELVKKNMIKIFLAKFKDQIIAVRISLYFNNKAYDWYAGSYDVHKQLNANDVLVWESLKGAINMECGLFDFGGAGVQGTAYGVRDFKSKFGGELKSFNIYNKIHNPVLNTLIQIGKRFI